LNLIKDCLTGINHVSEISGDTVFVYTDHADSVLNKTACFPEISFLHRQASLEDVFLKLTGRELRE